MPSGGGAVVKLCNDDPGAANLHVQRNVPSAALSPCVHVSHAPSCHSSARRFSGSAAYLPAFGLVIRPYRPLAARTPAHVSSAVSTSHRGCTDNMRALLHVGAHIMHSTRAARTARRPCRYAEGMPEEDRDEVGHHQYVTLSDVVLDRHFRPAQGMPFAQPSLQ